MINSKPLTLVEFTMANLYGRRAFNPDGSCVAWDRACNVEPGDELDHAEYTRLLAKGLPEISL